VVCREIRSRSQVPIIVVTARGEELDRVLLLELGADDYVVKPFGFRELVARIHAVLRRASAGAAGTVHTAPGRIEVGTLVIDQRTRAVAFDGRAVGLAPREYDLLVALAEDPGAVRSREQLIHDVWDENWWGSTKTLDVHIASLRKKLSPETIETVHSVGYRLAVSPAASPR
jgi:DNA-binding response OmpR family regulator